MDERSDLRASPSHLYRNYEGLTSCSRKWTPARKLCDIAAHGTKIRGDKAWLDAIGSHRLQPDLSGRRPGRAIDATLLRCSGRDGCNSAGCRAAFRKACQPPRSSIPRTIECSRVASVPPHAYPPSSEASGTANGQCECSFEPSDICLEHSQIPLPNCFTGEDRKQGTGSQESSEGNFATKKRLCQIVLLL